MKRFIIIGMLASGALAQTVTTPPPLPEQLKSQTPPKDIRNTRTLAAGNAAIKVYVTAHGKVYHTYRDCARLDRSTVLTSNENEAQTHGLTLCSICAHRFHVDNKAFGPKAGNGSWAKPEGK